jgi:predicted RNase H-like nuclease (RuvC/YqgF family)
LNEEYNEGKKYRVENIWQVFSVNDDKRKSYVCEKCIENKKKKYISEIEHVLDIQTGEFVYNIGKRSGVGFPYIYDNIIRFDNKYVHIPTGKTVIDTSYMKHDVNATEIHDYHIINVDKYIIFSATKFNGSFHNRYEVAVKLNKITGEVTEIE